jgi:nucleotide-binding universal stress UspA family protein
MNHILVPVDGSSHALNAVKAAIAATGKTQADLYIINVQPPVFTSNVKRFVSVETLDEYYHDEGEKALKDVRALLQSEGIDARVEIMVGPVAQTIAEYVNDKQCDLIIMGTRGMGSVSNLVLGSVATKVISLVSVPVMLVK